MWHVLLLVLVHCVMGLLKRLWQMEMESAGAW